MRIKVHWIIDGVAEIDAEDLEAAEAEVNEKLRAIVNKAPSLSSELGARAIQGKAYLPGSAEDQDT